VIEQLNVQVFPPAFERDEDEAGAKTGAKRGPRQARGDRLEAGHADHGRAGSVRYPASGR